MSKAYMRPVCLRDGRIIGNVVGLTFKTTRSGSRHLLREPVESWAFDLPLLLRLDREGVKAVSVRDRETNIVYTVSMERLLREGKEVPDYGYGVQWRLPVSAWDSGYAGPPARQLTFEEVFP